MNRKERRAAAKQGRNHAVSPAAAAVIDGPDVGGLLARAEQYHRAGQMAEAERSYRSILAINPSHIEALQQIGRICLQAARPHAAIEAFARVLARNDRIAECQYDIASAFAAVGQLADAAVHDQRAISLKPNFIEAYHHLAQTFFHLGRVDEALGVLRRAIDVGGRAETKVLFVQFLRSQRSIPNLDDLRKLMVQAMTQPWTRPSEIAPIAASLIKHDPALRPYIVRVLRAWPTRLPAAELLGDSGVAVMSGHQLLSSLLTSAPITDADLERFLIALRFALLEVAAANSSRPVDDGVLRLGCALARQCFLNEYVFAHDDGELDRACRLRHAIAGDIKSDAAVDELGLAVVGTYFPLYSVMSTAGMHARSWPKPLANLLGQQVGEPEQERQLRASVAALTAIDDTVSLRVQRQYEENPYPRWSKAAPPARTTSIGQYLRGKFPHAQSLEFSAVNDILIAGCGTGQHAVETAQRFSSARLLAIDLSLSSLAYAQRQTHSLGLANTEYAQADILRLGSIARRFDLIEAIGVLHHLEDPFRGWRALLETLRPKGLMQIGLYSRFARTHVQAARSLIAENGYRAIPDDIRRFRREIMDREHPGFADSAILHRVTQAEDFFTMSECRDLLFHVQEHQLTLPQIAAFVDENALTFIGFDVNAATQALYRARFPADAEMKDVATWHLFERENPDTFVGMYQFWVQKA
jgi:SAM-dependent methyltransferase/tetratricopeptide (TPR) repeat protein